jgi:putative peptidoglycan lipid II flippase
MAVSSWIMPMQVPGWTSEVTGMAIKMNMILVWLVPLCGLGALLSGALYSMHRYWLASSLKAINNLAVIAISVATYRSLGIFGLAVGYLSGALVQCVVLWVVLRRNGFRYSPRVELSDPALRETAKLVFYPLAGQMLGELRTLVENFCASFYAPGLLSALRYSARIVHSLSSVLMSSVVTAVTPTVAHFIAEDELEAMKRAIRGAMKLLLFMSVPICLWLIFDGDKLIGILFERGKFSHADAALTSRLISLMTPYIFFSRAISLVQTPFYAAKDTRTLVISMVWGFALYLATMPLMLFGFGFYGFPLVTSLSAALGTGLMCLFAGRSFGRMGWEELRSFLLRLATVAVVTSLGFLLGNTLTSDFGWSGVIGKCLSALVPSLLGFAAFAGTALAFRLADFKEISGHFWRLRARPMRASLGRSALSAKLD